MRYSASELRRMHPDGEFRSTLARIYAIRQFFRKGLRTKAFVVPECVNESVALSEAGKCVFEKFDKMQLSSAETKFLAFILLYHDELLIDIANTNCDALYNFLKEAVDLGTLKFPWAFEHTLYDRAFELFPDRPGLLNPAQTELLLTDTPPGVFQMGTILIGPFGVLVSREQRLLPPTLDLLLWHCDDTNCGAIHVGRLTQSSSELTIAYTTVRGELNRASAASSWGGFASAILSEGTWYDDLSWTNLPWLIGNAFTATELRAIVAEIVDVRDKSIRTNLPPRLAGSGKALAASLTKQEAMQLTLLARDTDIVAAIDTLVESGAIAVPPSEVRRSYPAQSQTSWLGPVMCECSALGVRVIPTRGEMQLARLRRLIESVYEGATQAENLRWHLRGFEGMTIGQQLEDYISKTKPATVLRDLIFTSPEKLRRSFEHLRAPHMQIPATVSEDDVLIQKLLWKLGFPQSRFDSSLRSFYETLDEFRTAAKVKVQNTEQWRSLVRGAGANVFVALEDVLDLALAFCSWLLLSDPAQEEHLYNHNRARHIMATELSGLVETPQGAVALDEKGKNTLFPLIAGFQALTKRIESLMTDPATSEKPRVLLAHYSQETKLQIFPYVHRHFVLDLAQHEVKTCLEAFMHIAVKFQDISVLNVRNRIDHRSESFPSAEEVNRCCETLEGGISRLETLGLFPNIYATASVQQDADGRTVVTSMDYSGETFRWNPSPMIKVVASRPDTTPPQIIVKCLHILGTNEPVRCRVETDSQYTLAWENYPKRRPPSQGDIDDAKTPTLSVQEVQVVDS